MIEKSIDNRQISSSKQFLIFSYAYGLMVIAASFFVNVNFQLFYTVKLTSFALFVFSIFFQNWTMKSFLRTLFIVIISLVVSYNSQSEMLIYLILPVIAMRNTNLKRVATTDLFFRSLGLFFTIVLFITGIIDENNLYRLEEGEVFVRHSLGYVHPNTLFMHVFIIAIDILVINYKKMRFELVVFLILLLETFSYITDSRTGMVVFYVLLIFIYLQKRTNMLKKSYVVRSLITYCVPIFITVSYILVWAYNKSINYIYLLDNILTGRIRSASYFINTYGFSLLGQPVEKLSTIDAMTTGQRAYILDNLYINLLVSYGLIFTFIYIILYVILIRRLIDHENEIAVLLVLVFFIYGFAEGIPLNIEYNYTVLLFSSMIFKTNKRLNN